MLNFLPKPLVGLLASLLLVANVLYSGVLVMALALVKAALPLRVARRRINRLLHVVAENWIAGNILWMRLLHRTAWDTGALDDLDRDGWYLVVSNHQSWVDIFVLQRLFQRRIPLLKFFLKHELIYIPVIGQCWWALDFPFMRRHDPVFLRAHPEVRGQDLAATRRACEKFVDVPTSVMNFLEGTRYTSAKQAEQRSPYHHLLRPKAGGAALALAVLGDKFRRLLDVTIVYPDGAPTFWRFLSGRVRRVVVRVTQRPIPAGFTGGDYEGDAAFRETFQRWVQELWEDKDRLVGELLDADGRADRPGRSDR